MHGCYGGEGCQECYCWLSKSDVNASGDVKFPIRLNCDKVVSKAREKSQIHNICIPDGLTFKR